MPMTFKSSLQAQRSNPEGPGERFNLVFLDCFVGFASSQ